MIKLKCNRKDAISTHYVGKEEKLTVHNILLNGMLDYIILPCMKTMNYGFEEAYIFWRRKKHVCTAYKDIS